MLRGRPRIVSQTPCLLSTPPNPKILEPIQPEGRPSTGSLAKIWGDVWFRLTLPSLSTGASQATGIVSTR